MCLRISRHEAVHRREISSVMRLCQSCKPACKARASIMSLTSEYLGIRAGLRYTIARYEISPYTPQSDIVPSTTASAVVEAIMLPLHGQLQAPRLSRTLSIGSRIEPIPASFPMSPTAMAGTRLSLAKSNITSDLETYSVMSLPEAE